jgi:HEAT repeat protein
MKKNPASIAKTRQNLHNSTSRCLDAIRNGKAADLFFLLPYIAVLHHDERFLEPLIAMLKDRSLRKREFAVLGLGALRDMRALNALFAFLHSLKAEKTRGQRLLRLAVLHAIGEIGSDQATHRLRDLLKTGSPLLNIPAERTMLVECLGHIAQHGGPEALDTLLELASSPDAELCTHAIPEIAVAYWHRPDAIPKKTLRLLLDRLHDEVGSVRAAAHGALETLAHLGCVAAERALDAKV